MAGRVRTIRHRKVNVKDPILQQVQDSVADVVAQVGSKTYNDTPDGTDYRKIQTGLDADLPTEHSEATDGRQYLAYDSKILYRDNGVAWVEILDSNDYNGPPFGEGTVFPTGPAVNDLFYRTDLDILFSWDGTFWNSIGSADNECSFNARKSGSQAITGGVGPAMTTITTYTSSHNFGAHMNMTTGIFTAPTAGVYEFSAWISLGGTIAVNSRIRYWINAVGGGETANGVANTRVGLIMTTGPILLAATNTMFAQVGTVGGVNPTVEGEGGGIICGFSGRRIMARF